MSGSVSKLGLARYPVSSFITGLNKAVGSYYVRDTDIVDAKNVEINLGGAIRPRKGLNRYDTASSQHFSDVQKIANAQRYLKGDGHNEIILQGGSNIYRDNASGLFTTLTMPHTMSESDDGLTRLVQWRDVLYLYSENARAASYNFNSSPETRQVSTDGFHGGTQPMLGAGEGTTDGFLKKDAAIGYVYRFTFERYHGNIFVSESLPTHYFSTGFDANHFDGNGVVPVNKGSITITVNVENSTAAIDDDIKFINIYRSDPVPNDIYGATEALERQYTGLFFLDQFDADDYRNGSTNDVLYTDEGKAELGSEEIFYAFLSFPPQAKFITSHKSRIWLADITAGDQGDGSGDPLFPFTLNIEGGKSRVYFSELLNPEKFRTTSFFDIARDDGEAITTMTSFENRFLILFKSNSMWGVFGGDIENVPGVPDIEIDVIDNSVGCIAPESMAYGEGGLIFLSNKGVYVYNGSRPIPMKSELIDNILANTESSRKTKAVGIYTQNRKYILSFTDATQDNSANTVSLIFDFITNTWSRNTYGNSTVYGVNKYIEAKRGSEAGQVYAVLDTTDSAVGAVQTLDKVQYDIDPDEGVAWSFKTKHFDLGDADAIKQIRTIIVRLNHTSPVTINYDIDDGCTTGTLTLTPLGCSGSTATAHTWDEVGLNWLGSAGQDITHVWGGAGAGGVGTQQNYVINVATSSTPNPKGRRIQFEFSGTANTQGQEFQGLTILYVSEPRVANA